MSQLQYGHWLATATQLPNGMISVMSDSPSPVGPANLGPTNLGAIVKVAGASASPPHTHTYPPPSLTQSALPFRSPVWRSVHGPASQPYTILHWMPPSPAPPIRHPTHPPHPDPSAMPHPQIPLTPLPSSAPPARLQNPFYEVWDPAHATKPTMVFQLSSAFTKNTKYFYYPFNFVLPTGRCMNGRLLHSCTPMPAHLHQAFL